MKKIITMNNALKYYNTKELVSNSSECREKLEMDMTAYNKMLGKVYGKYFMNKSFLSNM